MEVDIGGGDVMMGGDEGPVKKAKVDAAGTRDADVHVVDSNGKVDGGEGDVASESDESSLFTDREEGLLYDIVDPNDTTGADHVTPLDKIYI